MSLLKLIFSKGRILKLIFSKCRDPVTHVFKIYWKKEFLKSVNICALERQNASGLFFFGQPCILGKNIWENVGV